MSDTQQAKRYFISGLVQGVGFRYFTQRAAEKLNISGYARNLRDGRVEVFAMGTAPKLNELRSLLERGPRFCSVSEVREEDATPDPQYERTFVISNSASGLGTDVNN
ncbi:MAG TPA: acylphosphatase [Candidatus Dormibacteraeota bacterium]|nr:acylphosphatase [Candidatus Dormibacteraeota bacterium]